MNNTYYEFLGVDKSATQEEITKAYLQASHTYHPNNNKAPNAEVMFNIIGEAYTVLRDTNKRREYDLGLRISSEYTAEPEQDIYSMDYYSHPTYDTSPIGTSPAIKTIKVILFPIRYIIKFVLFIFGVSVSIFTHAIIFIVTNFATTLVSTILSGILFALTALLALAYYSQGELFTKMSIAPLLIFGGSAFLISPLGLQSFVLKIVQLIIKGNHYLTMFRQNL